MRVRFPGVVPLLILGGCAAAPPEQDPVQVAEGRLVAERECAACHAIGAGDSPRPGTPSMRDMLARYDADALANDFIQGMRVGHADMPAFDFDVRSADALIAFLRSISR